MTIFAPVARKARPGATARFSLITVAVLAVSLPAWGVYQWWAFRHRLRIDWNISGPACPIATHSWQSVALSRRPCFK